MKLKVFIASCLTAVAGGVMMDYSMFATGSALFIVAFIMLIAAFEADWND